MIVRYGIDPGKHVSGWACGFDDRLVACGLALDSRNWIPSFRPPGGVHECFIEMMKYRSGDRRSNPDDLIEVAYSAGCMARSLRADKTTPIEPRIWKRTVPKNIMLDWIRAETEKRPEELKLLAEIKCSAKLLENVIDAIGILFWANGRHRL